MSEVDDEFRKRQDEARARLNQLDADALYKNPKRAQFFDTIYSDAGGDAANVPWADLAPKPELIEWLEKHPGKTGKAMDVACGLGDHAEYLAQSGFQTTAFDYSSDAIAWARKRFPDSPVDYHVADLFNLPSEWIGGFDFVYECYTMQAMPPDTLNESLPAIASLVGPGGTLLVYSRVRPDGTETSGPPWPLEETTVMSFSEHGLELVDCKRFTMEKNDRSIPHVFCEWRRP